jgi:hypothetical protein
MAMTLQAVNAALDKGLTETMDHGTLAMLVEGVAANAKDPGLRQRCKRLVDGNGISDPLVFNVLSAGLFGVVPGGTALRPAAGEGEHLYRVNAFLHGIRKAILACKALDAVRQTNGRSYIFYPEFLVFEKVRQRVAALARAHAGMGPKNDELTVLYSLAGYFGLSDASKAVKVTGAGGTTCIMTARAVYHAAGCSMIGERPPTVNTPLGGVELGVPSLYQRSMQKNGQWITEKLAKVTVTRSDIEENGGRVFDENNEGNEPNLDIGDIYFVDGDGEHKFLMRGQGALAGHVGIIVGKPGKREFQTVDGGSGMGASIDYHKKREMWFKPNVGWTFKDSSLSFSQQEINWLEVQMARYADDASMEQAIKTESMFATIKPNLMLTLKNIETAPNEQLKKMHQKTLGIILDNARRIARQHYAGFVGEQRTIQGWWHPDRYTPMKHANSEVIRGLLAS